ncbi:unnamed protein product [Hermetia illucens]|uniref:BACK domain-containing protein n=1 Tax=Hermetia illucens TaxID=343691 RepID=A0A7R8V714_HERIL|nr:kelch repeat and BTB domain-containing protein 3-like [Hermetia illucens]XP_037923769.1 kelch repeat and BTB domain-containing protein 3-like [Hermetia illucens]CAD7093614.1 unnamed protein product [Hermetia illucens]
MAKKHMHTGNTRLRSDTVTGVFEMADFLRWDELPPHCIRFVQRSANLKNCISFWKLADFYSLHGLRTYLQTFICKSLKYVMKRTDFLELELKDVTRLLSDIRLKRSKFPYRYEMIYSALMQWIGHNVTERHAHIGSLLQLVRPEEISEHFLDEVVLENTLMMENVPAGNWLLNNFNV